ncbi:MAG: HEAT repeat domain-containing protein [Thermodesulfobacteriota bacterium]|nr:HEAT repeat domain-containing protein [Thermodesulfobacteriota bacterium]
MPRSHCPKCWQEVGETATGCPACGFNIQEFWNSKDYFDKFILALNHSEPNSQINAACVLGKLKDARAVDPLINLVKNAPNDNVAKAAVKALGEIGTPEARTFLSTLVYHPAKMIRDEVMAILAVSKYNSFLSNEKKGDHHES